MKKFTFLEKPSTVQPSPTPIAAVVLAPCHGRFTAKQLPIWSNQLVLSDSTYRTVQQREIADGTTVHSYSSATVIDMIDIVGQYPAADRSESVVMHVGQSG